jgi:hypothetical protein
VEMGGEFEEVHRSEEDVGVGQDVVAFFEEGGFGGGF